ncbi:hypothetical protein RI367_004602 [Sorochytrium milnesiophthora]
MPMPLPLPPPDSPAAEYVHVDRPRYPPLPQGLCVARHQICSVAAVPTSETDVLTALKLEHRQQQQQQQEQRRHRHASRCDSEPISASAAPPPPSPLRKRRPSLNGGNLVGSYEESLLLGRLSTQPSKPITFLAALGVLGKGKCKKPSLRCPPHVSLAFPAYFYDLHQHSDTRWTPYVGVVDLEEGLVPASGKVPRERGGSEGVVGYRVPPRGQLQVVIKNPNRTAVKVFLVPYDLSDMPPNTKTFLRQKAYAVSSAPAAGMRHLRFAVHLQFVCTPKKRIYVYKSIRVVFSPRTIESHEKLETVTDTPLAPLYMDVAADEFVRRSESHADTDVGGDEDSHALESDTFGRTGQDYHRPMPLRPLPLPIITTTSPPRDSPTPSSPILIPAACISSNRLRSASTGAATLRSPLSQSFVDADLPSSPSSSSPEDASSSTSVLSSLGSWHTLSASIPPSSAASLVSPPRLRINTAPIAATAPSTPSSARTPQWPRSCLVDENLIDSASGGTGLTGDFERDLDVFRRVGFAQANHTAKQVNVPPPPHKSNDHDAEENDDNEEEEEEEQQQLLSLNRPMRSSSRSPSPVIVSLLTEQLDSLSMSDQR